MMDYIRRLETSRPTKPGMYLHVYHGRRSIDEQLDDWGEDGPYFGPLLYCHITYCSTISLCAADDLHGGTGPMLPGDPLFFDGDMLVYDGMYYGDFILEMYP